MVRRQESPMVQVVRHQESPIGSHGETPGITERFKLQVRLHNLTPSRGETPGIATGSYGETPGITDRFGW